MSQISTLTASTRAFLCCLLGCGLALFGAGGAASEGRSPGRVKPVDPPTQVGNLLRAQLAEAGSLINAEQARLAYGVNGGGFTAAVLDTGIRATHNDFSGRIVAQVNFTSEYGGNAGNAADGEGHGTHVSGIIAANGRHTGIAPGASIAALKVLDNSGNGTFEDVRDALDWVIANRTVHNITVVNLSLGDGGNYTSMGMDAIGTRISTLRAAGVAVCAAAGNDFYFWNSAQGMNYPAVFPATVSVGAVFDANIGWVGYGGGAVANTTGPDRICPFSQRLHESVSASARTDIFAPGAAITSSGITGDNSSAVSHGTSQATPVIAGVILLLQDYYQRVTGNLPTVNQLENWLRAGAVTINDGDDENDNVHNTGLNFRRVDALAALQAAEQEVGATYSVSGTVTENGAGLANVTVTAGVRSATTNAAGQYTLTGLAPGTYTVQPSRAGYTFSPASRSVTVGPNRTGIDFTATATGPSTFTISGTVRAGNGSGIGAVTVQAGAASTVTNASGEYTLTGLVAGAYTVSAAHAAYAFAPASRSVTVGPDQSGIDFTGTPVQPNTYTISGSVTAGGATPLAGVQVNAGALGSAVTAANGTYTISGLSAGTYTVTASRAGYVMSPASRTVTVGPNATSINFVATPVTYSVSGTVRLNGTGLAGVTVSDGTRSVTTGASGQFTLNGVPPGSYTITPAASGYDFTPANRGVTVTSASLTGIDFTAAEATYRIAGRVTVNGTGLAGVDVSVGGAQLVTDSTGRYEATGLAPGSYSVQASRPGYQITPSSRTVTVGPSRADVDFSAAALYELRGRVTLNGEGLEGVTVSAGPRATATNAAGEYVFTNLTGGTYTITPSGFGYQFQPGSRAVNVSGNVTGIDFAALAEPTLSAVTPTRVELVGGKATPVTVTFDRPVTAKTRVTLTISDSRARAPKRVVLKRGKVKAHFKLKTRRVKEPVTVTITATAGSVTRQAAVTLLPRGSR